MRYGTRRPDARVLPDRNGRKTSFEEVKFMAANSYTAESIEVLTGLDPVKRRPGMYTDTLRPNHLGQEAIDNSVDEAIAGFASRLEVTLHTDGSLEVADNGRGMPVDIHPEEKVTGVEVIMTRLHAGAKFSNKSYLFSGGLHGVGVSVVNALSTRLEVDIKREGKHFRIEFAHGEKASELETVGNVGQRNTGTRIRFWPDPQYFDSPRFSVKRLRHTLRAKAVLCSGLQVRFNDRHTGQSDEWLYQDGLHDYLSDSLDDAERLPGDPLVGDFKGETETVDWALAWLPEGGETVAESYVNLIPTPLGGTHVNGLRSGLLASLREFCEFRKLLPRGGQAGPRGRLGPSELRAFGQDAGPPVLRPDQGAPRLPPLRRVRFRGGQGRLQPVAKPAHRGRREDRRTGHRQRPAPPQGQQDRGPQEDHQRSRPAG